MNRPLDALTFPLAGNHLIEASAGTGKTYTLAALYVRLVLGHGGDNGFGQPLLPPDILVVTFTEAATRELRDRIRQRLTEAARLFAAPNDDDLGADNFLRALRDSVPEGERAQQAARLRAAAQWMDDAAIYTIHGFCQRMLRQHAFDSGSLFTLELAPDEAHLLGTACNDYWRTFCLSLNDTQASWLAQDFPTPDKLLKALRPLLASHAALPAGSATPEVIIDQWSREYTETVTSLKSRWQQWSSELTTLFEAAWAQDRLPKSKPSKRSSIQGWLEKLAHWCSDPDNLDTPKAITDASLKCFSSTALRSASDHIEEIIAHPAIDHFAELKNPSAQLPALAPRLLPHACQWVAERLAQSKHQQALIGFDDMLAHLYHALEGPQGQALAAQIRRQYPFALIDEFQDTDPVQYGIFKHIYADQKDTGWLMIGDPKQAIYSFRGADIYTYLSARRDTAGNHHTLGTNFRSAAPLVSAINHVFERAQQAPGGAFRLGDEVPFQAVAASGRDEALEVGGDGVAPLTFWHLRKDDGDKDQSFARTAYLDAMASACAGHIASLLGQSQAGEAGFRRGGALTPLRPADIAILVRDRTEAERIRTALRTFNLSSVYLSDRDNVFAGSEARDLLSWLHACAEPDNEHRLRLALASASLNQDRHTLHALVSDETFWEDTAEKFVGYHRLWQQRGVLAMLRQLLRDFDVPARLLACPDGERLLTNLLHMGELLQQAASQLDGEQALLRWLAEMIDNSLGEGSNNAADEQILRLESDAGLIKVITMHKSKGLEYPLVFIPFACTNKPANPDRPPLRYHNEHGELVLTLSPDAREAALADEERLAEDLRLMYVAMTRARHACWLGIAATRNGNRHNQCELHRSAIGNLLGAQATTSAADIATLLAALAHPAISVTDAPDGRDIAPLPAEDAGEPGPARQCQRERSAHWWIASYSALKKCDAQDAPDNSRDDVLREESFQRADDSSVAGADAHAFPRGPLAGTFLHELLEWGAENGFERCTATHTAWQTLLAARCETRRWAQWQAPLSLWLERITHTALPVHEAPLVLASLPAHQYRAEMEFWLPVKRLDVAALDALVCQHTLNGQPRPPLTAPQLNGMLKGFIDLVLEHNGRYYVLDYKSNWLGPADDSYGHDALQKAIAQGRYDMQYCLYLLALHRLLRTRLGDDYDYDQHIGGSLYLFLRGIDHAGAGLFEERPPRVLIEAMDTLFREGHVNE